LELQYTKLKNFEILEDIAKGETIFRVSEVIPNYGSNYLWMSYSTVHSSGNMNRKVKSSTSLRIDNHILQRSKETTISSRHC
jgi:hypothetical protein